MSTFKPYPELSVVRLDPENPDDSTLRIALKNGDDFVVVVVQRSTEDVQRLVDCWNACRKLHSPAAHIAATDEYVERLEKLRKDAWARVAELEAEQRGFMSRHRSAAAVEAAQ